MKTLIIYTNNYWKLRKSVKLFIGLFAISKLLILSAIIIKSPNLYGLSGVIDMANSFFSLFICEKKIETNLSLVEIFKKRKVKK